MFYDSYYEAFIIYVCKNVEGVGGFATIPLSFKCNFFYHPPFINHVYGTGYVYVVHSVNGFIGLGSTLLNHLFLYNIILGPVTSDHLSINFSKLISSQCQIRA